MPDGSFKRFDWIGWSFEVPDLTPSQAHVLFVLADMANEEGECWPSIPTVASRCRITERGAQLAMRHLEQVGIVTRSDRFRDNKSHASNLYTLHRENSVVKPVHQGVVKPPHQGGELSAPLEPPTEPPATERKAEGLRPSRGPSRPRRKTEPPRDPDGGMANLWGELAPPSPVEDDEPESTPAREPGATKQTSARRPTNPDSVQGLLGYWRTALTKKGLWGTSGGYDYVAEIKQCFGALLTRGSTAEQVRRMIDMFLNDSSVILNGEVPAIRKFKAHANRVQHRVKMEAEQALASAEDYVEAPEDKVYDMSVY